MSPKIRLGLMAGAAMLASSPVLAANECGNPSANGAAADSFTCASPPTYTTGLDYRTTSDGDLTIILQNRFDTGTTATGGIRMFGDTGEDMTLRREDNPAGAGDPRIANTAGRAIDITTQGDGNIVINLTDGDPAAGESTNATTGNAPVRITGSTDAIRTEAFGSGNVGVVFGETGVPSGTDHPRGLIISGANGSGIVARSTSGDINIDTRGANFTVNATSGGSAVDALSTSGDITINTTNANGRLRGILAQTGGAGVVAITVNGNVAANGTTGLAGIDVITGTGGVAVTLAAGSTSGGAGAAIRAASASAVNVQNTGATVNGRVDFSNVTAGGVIFNNNGTTGSGGVWTATGASVFSNQADVLTLAGVTTSNTLAAGASISFAGGADTFNLSQSLTAQAGTLDFGTGADVFNLSGLLTANGTAVNFGAGADAMTLSGQLTATDMTMDFGADADTFNQNGVMFWNGTTAIAGLEAFNNTGGIYLGGDRRFLSGNTTDTTDGSADDILVLTSGVFTGSGGSFIALDANLGTSGSQIGCATPTVADCANFTGAATAGSTLLKIKDIAFSTDGGTLGAVITLVQGSTGAEHFDLDPASDFYAQTPQGPALRKPVVAYQLSYDVANQRHVLVGAPTDELFQVGTFAASAQEVWRSTAGSWLTRQADLRATPGGLQPSRGVWGRAGGQSSERDAEASYQAAGLSFGYDLGQKQRIAHLQFGADLVANENLVAGAIVGFVRSDVEFDATPTEAAFAGFAGGLYASYVAGPLFVDGLLNLNTLHVKAEAPQMGLGLDVPMTFDMKSLGGQVEAGWRFGEGLFVEPLAGVAYVRTKFDDAAVPGGSGAFDFADKYESLRIGGGARVGMDGDFLGMAASYSLTGRYWDESKGQVAASIVTANGSSAALGDEFSGGFSEVAASLGLYSHGGGLSGFVTLGGKVGGDYQAVDGAAGVRVRW